MFINERLLAFLCLISIPAITNAFEPISVLIRVDLAKQGISDQNVQQIWEGNANRLVCGGGAHNQAGTEIYTGCTIPNEVLAATGLQALLKGSRFCASENEFLRKTVDTPPVQAINDIRRLPQPEPEANSPLKLIDGYFLEMATNLCKRYCLEKAYEEYQLQKDKQWGTFTPESFHKFINDYEPVGWHNPSPYMYADKTKRAALKGTGLACTEDTPSPLAFPLFPEYDNENEALSLQSLPSDSLEETFDVHIDFSENEFTY